MSCTDIRNIIRNRRERKKLVQLVPQGNSAKSGGSGDWRVGRLASIHIYM